VNRGTSGQAQRALRLLVRLWARNEPITTRAVLGVLGGRRGGEVAAELNVPANKPATWVNGFLADLHQGVHSEGMDSAELMAVMTAGGPASIEDHDHGEVQRAAAAGGGGSRGLGGDAVGGVPGVRAAAASGGGAVQQRGLAVPQPGQVPGAAEGPGPGGAGEPKRRRAGGRAVLKSGGAE